MFTWDVKALYPSIPRDEARKACKNALNERTNQDLPTEEVLQIIDTVLENSYFTFNKTNYQQIDGTAIGSKLGRNYACTYMGDWEEELLKRSKKTPKLYLRYVDDIFGIWDDNEESLEEFFELANAIHENIKLEMTTSTTKINFLDVIVSQHEDGINTTIYSKPTDRHLYLHKNSCHPSSIKKAIPYGLGIRAKRICSTEKEYKKNKDNITKHLKQRGYSYKEIKQMTNKVDNKPRNDLLQYRQNETENSRIPLVITYNKSLPNIQDIVHRHMYILHGSKKMRKVFDDAPITAYRRDTNLEEILIHAKHKRIFEKEDKGTCQCKKKCIICRHFKTGTKHKSIDGKIYTFSDHIDCKTYNVIYGIFCKKCDAIIYVGETGCTIYERFQNHLSAIKREKDEPVATHFNDRHSIEDFSIVGIERIKKKDIHYRKVRESFWIEKLGTINPHGLNQNYGAMA